MKMSVIIVHTN